MQKLFRLRKTIGLTMAVSIFLLNFPQSPARAVMISTEYVQHRDSEKLSDRTRLSAFLQRTEVMAQLQAHGISLEEAQSRTESLTDREIIYITQRMDQLPSGAYSLDGGILTILGIALYAIIAAIVIYFSNTEPQEEKTK